MFFFEKINLQNILLCFRSNKSLKENVKPHEFNSSFGSQVFSPLRDVSAVGLPSPALTPSATTPLPLQMSNCSRMSSDSVLSPLRETSFKPHNCKSDLPLE